MALVKLFAIVLKHLINLLVFTIFSLEVDEFSTKILLQSHDERDCLPMICLIHECMSPGRS